MATSSSNQSTSMQLRKRSREEIIGDSVPRKSRKFYETTWADFYNYSALPSGTKPTETHFLQFFDHLRNEKNYKKQSLWVKYSHLTACYSREFGEDLKQFPTLKLLLKSYENSPVTQANTFTQEEIQKFMKEEFDDRFFLMRQAIVAVAICGGMRMIEVRGIKMEDLRETAEGYRVTHRGAKEKQEIRMRSFLIPSQCETPYALRIKQYLEKVYLETKEKKGPLFRGCMAGKMFVKAPLGKSKLGDVGKDVARFLNLGNPGRYTGHCFRRTAATNASANSASTTNLQAHFGWSDQKTALKYIDSNEKNQNVMAEKITGESLKARNVSHKDDEEVDDNNNLSVENSPKKESPKKGSKKKENCEHETENEDEDDLTEEADDSRRKCLEVNRGRRKNKLSLKNRKIKGLKGRNPAKIFKNITINIS